jgi:hypothetical protein
VNLSHRFTAISQTPGSISMPNHVFSSISHAIRDVAEHATFWRKSLLQNDLGFQIMLSGKMEKVYANHVTETTGIRTDSRPKRGR